MSHVYNKAKLVLSSSHMKQRTEQKPQTGWANLVDKIAKPARMIQEERPEPTGSRGHRHDPDHCAHGRRHHRRHPGREHGREQCRECPHRGFHLGVLTEAEEEQHEGDGGRVAPGVVDGEPRVARQDAEAQLD